MKKYLSLFVLLLMSSSVQVFGRNGFVTPFAGELSNALEIYNAEVFSQAKKVGKSGKSNHDTLQGMSVSYVSEFGMTEETLAAITGHSIGRSSTCCPEGQGVCNVKEINLNCDLTDTTAQEFEPEFGKIMSVISMQNSASTSFQFEKGDKNFCEKCYKKVYASNGKSSHDFNLYKDQIKKKLNEKIHSRRITKTLARMSALSDITGSFSSIYGPYIGKISKGNQNLYNKLTCADGAAIKKKMQASKGCQQADIKELYRDRVETSLARINEKIKFGKGELGKKLLKPENIVDLVQSVSAMKKMQTNECGASRDEHSILNYALFNDNSNLSGAVYGSLDVLLNNEQLIKGLSGTDGFCKSSSNMKPKDALLKSVYGNEYDLVGHFNQSSNESNYFPHESYKLYESTIKSNKASELAGNLNHYFNIAMAQDPNLGILLSDKTSFCSEIVDKRVQFYETPKRNRKNLTYNAKKLFRMENGDDKTKMDLINDRINSIAENQCGPMYDELVGTLCASADDAADADMDEVIAASNEIVEDEVSLEQKKFSNIALGSLACSSNLTAPKEDKMKALSGSIDLTDITAMKKMMGEKDGGYSTNEQVISYDAYVNDRRYTCTNNQDIVDAVQRSIGLKKSDYSNLKTNKQFGKNVDNRAITKGSSDVEQVDVSLDEASAIVAQSNSEERGIAALTAGGGSLKSSEANSSPESSSSQKIDIASASSAVPNSEANSNALNLDDLRGTIDQSGISGLTSPYMDISPTINSGINPSDVQAAIQENEEVSNKFVTATEQLKDAGIEDNDKLMDYLGGESDELTGLLGENDELKNELEELKKLVAQNAVNKKQTEQKVIANESSAKDKEIESLKKYIANFQKPSSSRAPASTQVSQVASSQAASSAQPRSSLGSVSSGQLDGVSKYASSAIKAKRKSSVMPAKVSSKLLNLVSAGNYEDFSFEFKNESLQLVSDGQAYDVTLDDIVLSGGVVTKIKLSGKEIDVSQLQAGSQSALNLFIKANEKVADEQLKVVSGEKQILEAKNDAVSEELKRYRDLLAGLAE